MGNKQRFAQHRIFFLLPTSYFLLPISYFLFPIYRLLKPPMNANSKQESGHRERREHREHRGNAQQERTAKAATHAKMDSNEAADETEFLLVLDHYLRVSAFICGERKLERKGIAPGGAAGLQTRLGPLAVLCGFDSHSLPPNLSRRHAKLYRSPPVIEQQDAARPSSLIPHPSSTSSLVTRRRPPKGHLE
jgi:hypothetical protein